MFSLFDYAFILCKHKFVVPARMVHKMFSVNMCVYITWSSAHTPSNMHILLVSLILI